MGEKMRIYVGGLGKSVREDDLKKTFGSPHLGSVESVEINRDKGRSFGYMDFVPASDKALAKLFSAYNGCMWKGGKLRLEKARENYMSCLQREWREDADLAIKLATKNDDADETMHALPKLKEDQDIERMQLRIFFPKLRKIKPVPLKGTGKHKYSFQRVEVPPLPINFCDCEEHSRHHNSAKKKCINDPAKNNCVNDPTTETSGVDEHELNIMKLVLDKILEKENCSNTVSNEAEFTAEINNPVMSVDNLQIGDDEENQVSDDDNLVINVVARPSNRVAPVEDWQLKRGAAYQDSLSRESELFSVSQKGKLLSEKKRKASLAENVTNDNFPSKRKVMKGSPQGHMDKSVASESEQIVTEAGPMQLGTDVVCSHKSAWKSLVREKGSTAFHISDILTNLEGDHEVRTSSAAPCSNDKDVQSNKNKELEKLSDNQSNKLNSFEGESARGDNQDDQTDKNKQLETIADVKSNESIKSEDKPARGASWLLKSSWGQLVGDTNKSSFSISQILPDSASEKHKLQTFETVDFSVSRNGEQISFAQKDAKILNGETSKLQGRASKDIHTTPRSFNVESLISVKDHTDIDSDKFRSDAKPKAEQKDEVLAAVPSSNEVPSNRPYVPDIVISETCPFMRSAASMKEWAKTKAALSGSLKKKAKAKEKETNMD